MNWESDETGLEIEEVDYEDSGEADYEADPGVEDLDLEDDLEFGSLDLETDWGETGDVEADEEFVIEQILSEPDPEAWVQEDFQEDMGMDEFGAGLEFGGFELEGEADLLPMEDFFETDEEFFKKIGRFVKRAAKRVAPLVLKAGRVLGKVAGPLFKKLAPIAAKIIGGVIGGPAGAAIAGSIAGAVVGEAEVEGAGDAEYAIEAGEEEFSVAGGDQEAAETMEAWAARAAETDSEAAASRAVIHMSAQAVRLFRANPRVRPAIPHVLRAAVALAATFRRSPKTRWAVKTIPLIVRRTLTRLSRQRRITAKIVIQAMALETAWVLANRRRAVASLRHHNAIRRRGVVRRSRRPGPKPRRRRRARRSF